jgi:very-long-chain enoyl-CoA reductase
MEVVIENRLGRTPTYTNLVISTEDNLTDLRVKIKKNLGLSININRIGISFISSETKKKEYISNTNRKVHQYDIKQGTNLVIKDLGIQLDYRSVYIIEYLGPFLINILFFLYNKSNETTIFQYILFTMIFIHYLKRILESLFVHIFSRDTMPIKNLFINSFYYWVMFGLLGCSNLYTLSFSKSSHFLGSFRYLFIVSFLYSEFQNFRCHLHQKKLKEDNKGERGIPVEGMFYYVSCANYFWEIMAWLSFSVFSNHWTSYLFVVMSLFILSKWSMERHMNYIKTFSNYPRSRKALIPYIY